MRKSTGNTSVSPEKTNLKQGFSEDINDQYIQLAQFLTNLIQDVSNSKEKHINSQEKTTVELPAIDDNLEKSRRKSSVINNLKSPILKKFKEKPEEKTTIFSKNNDVNINKNDDIKENQQKKPVLKRIMSSMDLETGSQELFSNGPSEKANEKPEISIKTLKVR